MKKSNPLSLPYKTGVPRQRVRIIPWWILKRQVRDWMKQIRELERKPKARQRNIKKANEKRAPVMSSMSVDSIQNNQYGTHYPQWELEVYDSMILFTLSFHCLTKKVTDCVWYNVKQYLFSLWQKWQLVLIYIFKEMLPDCHTFTLLFQGITCSSQYVVYLDQVPGSTVSGNLWMAGACCPNTLKIPVPCMPCAWQLFFLS